MNLTPLSEFVLMQTQKKLDLYDWLPNLHVRDAILVSIENYTKFLKQPLTLGMFVPCDENGDELTDPENIDIDGVQYYAQLNEYEEAEQYVLFEGFQVKGGRSVARAICQTLQTVEDLTNKKTPLQPLTLTPSALKAIGIKE